MKNNKGQVLVVFILLLPLIFMLLAFILDIGLLYTEKYKLNSNIKEAINYGLNNIEDNNIDQKLETIIHKNIKNIKKLNIDIEENKITIKIEKTRTSIFKYIFKNPTNNIESSYKGYKDNDKIIINKEV